MKSSIFSICKMIGDVSWCQSGIEYTLEKSSWQWNDLWQLLINIGCRFEKDTLINIQKWCDESRYNLSISMPDEGHYASAAQSGHISFCMAYENLMGRVPFIKKGIAYHCSGRRYNCHNSDRSQGRLVIGCGFTWWGEDVIVTSFKDSENTLTACSYHTRKDGYRGKIKKRFKIAISDLRADIKWQKAVKEFPTTEEYRKVIQKLNISSWEELATRVIDIAKLKNKKVPKTLIEKFIESQTKLKAALPSKRVGIEKQWIA